MKKVHSISPLIAVAFFTGCFDLDSSLFNNDTLSSYTLSTSVIPDSMRTEIIMTSQGKKIYGYFVRSSDPAERNVILYHHGNRDHLQFYWDRVELFYGMGFNVFVYDYQGYGKSEGTPSEAAVYADAIAAYNHIRSRGFADNEICVYGFSLGGAPAVHLASSVFTPKKLILEAPFASASALTQSATLLDLPSTFVMKGEYNNAEKIKRSVAPLLIIFGVNDTFIDIDKNGRVIYANANDPKEFVAVQKAGHSDIPAVMGHDSYIATVKQFVSK
jgi:hypothetical protein